MNGIMRSGVTILTALTCFALVLQSCEPHHRPVKDPVKISDGKVSGTEEDGVRISRA